MKTAIVCEGGGMRGVYTAGVLQAFMNAGFVADELVGVSAGASNGASYVSHQAGRGYRTNVDYIGDKRYMSLGNWLRRGSFFGMDFIFGEIPERLDSFDYAAFAASPCAYYAGATDVETGEAVFFGKTDIKPGLAVLRASCSLPVLGNMIEVKGRKYLDGGLAAPIPIQKALADGCGRLIVVLTRPRGYSKSPQGNALFYRAFYHKYPAVAKAIARRHLVYNHALEELRQLEADGKAVVVAPAEPLPAGRLGGSREKMDETYTIGLADGAATLRLM